MSKRFGRLLLLVFFLFPVVARAQWRLQSYSKEDLFGVWGSSPRDIYLVGANGMILHSTNNGVVFTQEPAELQETLYSVWGSGADNVFAVGANGALLHTQDGGKTWLPRSAGVRVSLRCVWGIDGYLFVAGEAGTLLRSQDGRSWQVLKSGTKALLYGVWGSSSSDLYAIGEQGLILHSTDQGSSWSTLNSGTTENLRGIWGSGPENIFVVGYRGTILQSSDRGKTWAPKKSGTQEWLSGVFGSAPGVLYAVGSQGVVLLSEDNGETWALQQAKATTPLYGVVALSPVHIYCVGRKGNLAYLSPIKPLLVLKTSDGDSSAEGAEAFLNDKPLGTVPLTTEVSTGSYVLQLKKEGFRSVTYEFELKEGDIYTLPVKAQERQVAFLKALGSIRVEGPAGAKVYLDRELQGVAPMTISNVTLEQHVIRMEKEGYVDWFTGITVEEKNEPLTADMKREITMEQVAAPARTKLYEISMVSGAVWLSSGALAWLQFSKANDAQQVSNGGSTEAREEVLIHQKRMSQLGILSDISGGLAIVSLTAAITLEHRDKAKLNKKREARLTPTPNGAAVTGSF